MDLGLNLLDFVLLGALVYALGRGYMQGAVSQVAAFGGAAAGLGLGAWLAPAAAGLFVDGPGATLSLLTLGMVIIAILLGQGIGFTIGLRLRRVAERAGIAPLDRAAGMGVGAAGLVVVVWLLGSMLAQGPVPELAQQVRGSRIVGLVDDVLPPAPDVVGRVGGYLDQQGFPQVFSGMGGGVTAPPVAPTSDEAVRLAAEAGRASTVQIQATGCGGRSFGSGFVTRAGFVVTNAHVIAGADGIVVRDTAGQHDAVAIHFDSQLDLAVLAAPNAQATPIGWVGTPADRGTEGATLGFPGGQRQLQPKAATVRGRGEAVGRDIYGGGLVTREVLTLAAPVQRGDSGGPFVTRAGAVGGVVFAADAAQPGTGYALTAERVRPDVEQAMARNTPVDTGACRF